MNTHNPIRTTAVAMLALCAATAFSVHAAPSLNTAAHRSHTDTTVDVHQFLAKARNQLKEHRYAEATESYVWLWNNIIELEPLLIGIRGSFMINEIKPLIQAYPDARTAFTQIRDESKRTIDQATKQGTTDHQALQDWIVLSHNALGDSQPVLDWAVQADTTEEGQAALERQYFLIDDLLLESGHAAILGRALPSGDSYVADAIESYNRVNEMNEKNLVMLTGDAELDERIRQDSRLSSITRFADTIADAHIAYLAADRDEEAWSVLTQATKAVDEPIYREAVFLRLHDAGIAEQRHIDLLNY